MSLKAIVLSSLIAMNPVLDDLADSLRARGISEKKIEKFVENNDFEVDPRIKGFFESNPEKDSDEGKITYEEYRDILGLDRLITMIPGYVEQNKEDLLEAQKKYGVDHRYIAAIKGVESRFGDNTGYFNLINSLYSQFNMESRRGFASDHMASLLRFSEKKDIPLEKLDKLKSSYAGAAGQGQFLPRSLESKFVKVDDDLFTDRNFIFSIANYLSNNRANHPVTGEPLRWDPDLNNEELAVRVGNYYAIWGYNRNVNYVKAVHELANALEYKGK